MKTHIQNYRRETTWAGTLTTNGVALSLDVDVVYEITIRFELSTGGDADVPRGEFVTAEFSNVEDVDILRADIQLPADRWLSGMPDYDPAVDRINIMRLFSNADIQALKNYLRINANGAEYEIDFDSLD